MTALSTWPKPRGVRPVDREHVERLAFAVDHPPIDVVKLAGDRFGILAGYRRLAAHQVAEKKTIRIVVHDLAVEEWHPFAVRSNLTHGLPLTLAQRKAAARQMLDDTPRRSDRAIAADCGLSDKTIAKLKRPEGAEATAESPQLRVGRDGKARRMPGPTHEEVADNEPDPAEPGPGIWNSKSRNGNSTTSRRLSRLGRRWTTAT